MMKRVGNCLFLLLGVCFVSCFTDVAAIENLTVILDWSQLEFEYNSSSQRQSDIDTGYFNVSKAVPIDVDVYYSDDGKHDLIFVTAPKLDGYGSPATLGTVIDKKLNGNPIIRPYPDWSWHRNLTDCKPNRMVSVFRTKIDECGRIWVLDVGSAGGDRICPPQILAFDLKTDQLVHRYEFNSTVYNATSYFVNLAVDVRNPNSGCNDTFIYIADPSTPSLVVYDAVHNNSWKDESSTFDADPDFINYTIAGESFDLRDGIIGMALSPLRTGEVRKLFYHAMTSGKENWVNTSSLRHPTSDSFQTYATQRDTQSAAEAMDKNGVLFFGLVGDCQIACWNIKTEYGPDNWDIVASDTDTLQFPGGMKVIKNHQGSELLFVMTSRFQKYIAGTLNATETNFRILAGKVDTLVGNGKCRI